MCFCNRNIHTHIHKFYTVIPVYMPYSETADVTYGFYLPMFDL